MRRALRIVTLLAAVALLAMPLAATQAHSGVVAFTGSANLGAPISFPACTTSNLGQPLCNPADTYWTLVANGNVSGERCVDAGLGGAGAVCKINMDGKLTAALNDVSPNQQLGPWCGASGGTTVGGHPTTPAPDTLTDSAGNVHTVTARWITSAGTILPLDGTYVNVQRDATSTSPAHSGGNGRTVILTRSAAGPPITSDPVGSLTATTVLCLNAQAKDFGVIGLSLSL